VWACGGELRQGGLRDRPGVAPLLAVQIPPSERALDDPELDFEPARIAARKAAQPTEAPEPAREQLAQPVGAGATAYRDIDPDDIPF
jgi:hypothetical protein